MNAILISIKGRHGINLFKGTEKLELRKKFPKDFKGWVYIYCTQGKDRLCRVTSGVDYSYHYKLNPDTYCETKLLNGLVIAKFWCDKAKHFEFGCWSGGKLAIPEIGYFFDDGSLLEKDFMTEKCSLSIDEFCDRFECKDGYIVLISKLEIFKKPRELKDFKVYDKSYDNVGAFGWAFSEDEKYCPLKSAPKNWRYVEE